MGPGQPLLHELVPPPDPWETARRLAHLPHLLFFDSAGGPPTLARYSYVSADPFATLTSFRSFGPERQVVAWNDPTFRTLPTEDPFTALAEVLARSPATAAPALPPFQGGAAGLFGYGLARVLERLPKPKSEDFWLHDLVVGFYDWVVAFDNYQGRAWLVSTGWPETDAARRRDRADR